MLLWILASRSPRRRAFMSLLGLPHEVVSADVEESPLEGEGPQATALRLGLSKAGAIASEHPRRRIIAADTVVVVDDAILGKPADGDEAAKMLRLLRGRPHRVISGLAVLDGGSGRGVADFAATEVWMRDYTDGEIRSYVRTGDPLDKAGAYAIQHGGFRPVDRMEGCYASVMGFPMCHLRRALRRLGIPFEGDVPALCLAHTDHSCRMYPQVLAGKPLWRFSLPVTLDALPWEDLRPL